MSVQFPYVIQPPYSRQRVKRLPVRRQQPRQQIPRNMFSVSELKYFDTEVSAVNVPESTDWTATELSAGTIALPTEGSDIDNRVGRKISVYKVVVRGVIRQTVEAATSIPIGLPSVRLILYVDQQTNGTASQGEQLMLPPTNASVADAFSSLQNPANFGRFRVLRDVVLRATDASITNASASTSGQTCSDLPFKLMYRFKKPLQIRFNATNGGTIADVVDNSICLLGQKSTTGYATPITYRTRIYYKDG